MKKILTLLLVTAFFIGGFHQSYAQITVTGKVTDQEDEALPGVNVIIKGTNQGTVTDLNGNYTIEASEEDNVLVFSFVGFTTEEVSINGRSSIDISLTPDLGQLEEVVVVGYGTQKKRDITGAVSTVEVEELEKSQFVTLTDRLQGRIAGVTVNNNGEPGSQGDIKIRGTAFLGGNQPLYVIDGVLTEDSPALNPNDVESIQVLKDASATAIYGSRAANGVVVITTKSEKRTGRPEINFKTNIGMQQIPNQLDMANSQQWARIVNSAHDNGGLERQDKAVNVPDFSTDWQDEVFNNNALLQDYNLSIAGGGENNSVYFSANHTRQEGTIKGPKFERYTARLNTEFNPIENLTVGEHLTIGRSNSSGVQQYGGVDFDGPTVLNATFGMLPVIPVRDPSFQSGFGHGQLGIASTFIPNPVGIQELFNNEGQDTRILGDIYLNYEIIEGLEFRTSFGYNANFGRGKSFYEAGQIRMTTVHLSGLSEERFRDEELFFENRLTYNKEIGNHEIGAMVTYTEQEINGSGQSTFSNGGYDVADPFWVINASTASAQNITSNGSEFSSAIRSYLGRLTYKFDDRYLITGIIRRDGSSKFAEENRWGTFPSISGGWNVHNENFFNVPFISNLKLRAGYGVVGNASIGDYAYQSSILSRSVGGVNYNLGPNSTQVIGATRGEIVNRDIKWETLKETNIGADIELLDGKFSVTGDYYFSDLEDLLTGVPVPATIGAGGGEPTINAVTMSRSGWEAALTYNKNEGDFNFSISANAFATNNEVKSLPFGVKEFFGANSISRPGTQLGNLFTLNYQGIYRSQEEIDALPDDFTINGVRPEVGDARYEDVDSRDENGELTGEPDGQIRFDDDRKVMGDPIPSVQYGLNFSGSWKNLDFTVFFQGLAGRDVYNTYFEGLNLDHGANYTADYDPWIDGSGSEPRAITGQESGNNFPSSKFIENGGYLRLKNLQIGYSLPWNAVQNLRIYISGQNLFAITDYKGLDPEFEGGIFEPGLDPQGYPNLRTYSAGINITL